MNANRLAIAGVIVALAFWRAFGLWRFYDDWVFADAANHALATGTVASFIWEPLGQHWSPLWKAFDIFNLWAVGWQSDWLVRGLVVATVFAAVALCGRLASRFGASPIASALAMAVLGLHHLNAAAYYSFDTYPHVAVDLCSWIVVTLLVTFGFDSDRASSRKVVAAFAIYAVGLFIKEQGLSGLAGATVVVLWWTWVGALERWRPRMLWTVWSAMLAWAVVFAVLRHSVGTPLYTDGPYSLCLRCVPGNVGLMLGGLVVPVRTMTAYFALLDPAANPAAFVTTILGASAIAAAIIIGLSRWSGEQENRRRALLIAALIVGSFFPTALLSHVGELYPHTALFWFAILVALAFDGWRARVASTSPPMRRFLTAAAVTYVAMLCVGLRANLADMRATGERARSLQAAFNNGVRGVAAGTTVVVRGLDPIKAPSDYSLYRLTTPGMLLGYSGPLRFTADPAVTIVDEEEWLARKTSAQSSQVLVADFSGGQLSLQPMTAHRR